MNFKVEKTDDVKLFKVTELKDVQVIGNGTVKAEGNSWIFSIDGLESEKADFQAEIDKRNEIINLINEL